MIGKNNIFNIRKGPRAWKGETGANKGFVEFESREYGIRAWIVLMRTYRQKHRCATVRATFAWAAPWRRWRRERCSRRMRFTK